MIRRKERAHSLLVALCATRRERTACWWRCARQGESAQPAGGVVRDKERVHSLLVALCATRRECTACWWRCARQGESAQPAGGVVRDKERAHSLLVALCATRSERQTNETSTVHDPVRCCNPACARLGVLWPTTS